MIKEFNDFPWHDAELKEIIIGREENDDIRILIRWPEDFGSETVIFEFYDCYAFQADMHFGVVPPDSILEAECMCESQELDNIKNTWKKMYVNLSELHCFRIITNSTNSTINIFALGYRVININSVQPM